MTAYAAQRARLMFGCFRKGEANDPDTYVAAITATLARFPEEIITAVTHPTSGLPIQEEWLPSVRRVYLACTEAWQPIKAAAQRDQRIAEQLAERTKNSEADARIRKGLDELSSDLKRGIGP